MIADRLTTAMIAVVCELVDKPTEVCVSCLVGTGRTIVLTIRTGSGDIGKVIGKHGRTVDALRFLLEAMAARHKLKIVLEIDDTATRTR